MAANPLTQRKDKPALLVVKLDPELELAVLLDEMTEPQASFIAAFVLTRSQALALEVSGLSSVEVLQQRLQRPRFDESFRAAELASLEAELWRRAVDGLDEPITFQGVVTGTWKRKSDGLLKILLASRDPDRYGEKSKVKIEKSVTITHTIGGENIAAHWENIEDETDAAMRDLDRLLPAPKPRAIDAEFSEP